MDSALKIAFVTAEVRPFAATGGLADVAAALPKELRRLGHDVRLIMPHYAMIEAQRPTLQEIPALREPILVPNEGRMCVKATHLPNTDVPVYLLQALDRDYYSRTHNRDQIYGWPDDGSRFIFLCRGTLELLNALDWTPDVIHCNDWHAGLIPTYLQSVYRYDFPCTASVYTSHNLLYSGPDNLSAAASREAGLGRELLPLVHPHEYYGHFNFAKGALLTADVVNTVSPTYAEEVLLPESEPLPYEVRIPDGSQVLRHRPRIPNGVGFCDILRYRRQSRPFVGILNGIDADYWNPRTDALLEIPTLSGLAQQLSPAIHIDPLPLSVLCYGADDAPEQIMARKVLHKRRLQRLCGLALDDGALLIGRVARIGDQKDYVLMAEDARALSAMMGMPCQFVVLGRASGGDTVGQWYRREYTRFDQTYPDRLCYLNSRCEQWLGQPLPPNADFELEHLIYAGCDAFLIPSLYEPCGLTQMVSLRYGTVPIVRRTGGLADTVRDASEPPHPVKGGGFVFVEPSPAALTDAVWRAVNLYRAEPDAWRALVLDGMQKDFSWTPSAHQYLEAYRLSQHIRRGGG